jgi:hypothetical protein
VVAALQYLEAHGLTRDQLSALHHFSLKHRPFGFAAARRYFEEPREWGERNAFFVERVLHVARAHQQQAQPLRLLVADALRRWPLK